MENRKKYYLGLDIGTDSVGYAVTDPNYTLLKFHGEPAWGVTLFDAAGQASERRTHRVDRRRTDRRQQRVRLLQELFAAEIGKIDPRFYIRQTESALYPEDKQEPYSLFNDAGYTDAQYHADYPTIHHLIDELMNSDEPHDVRLVYLACAWLVAHRGHFLSQISKDNVDAVTSFSTVYKEFHDYLIDSQCAIPWREDNLDGIASALRMDTGVTKKMRALAEACFPGGKAPKEPVEGFPYSCDELLRALAGGKVTAAKLFDEPGYSEIEGFSLDKSEEDMEKLVADLGEDGELIVHLKALYDWPLLAKALDDGQGEACATISKAKIAVYEQHKRDLELLKRIIRKYCPEAYAPVFRDDGKGANYVAYSYHGIGAKTEKVNQEAFCKYIKSILKNVEPDEADRADFDAMLARLEKNSFMPKQKTGDNRVIPYQLYWHELDTLLRRAEAYLPFLAQKDEDGLTVSEKIRNVFSFRVPYFVGPLGQHGKNRWAVRTDSGRITPWNFENKIDQDASEEAFIRRMTNKCTYLPDEDVLPKDSLLYHRFTVLNEINNIKVNGVPITAEQKQRIYNDVFLRYRKVKVATMRNYMLSNGMMAQGDELTGIDTSIKSDLKPWHDFKRLMDNGILSEADAERIIQRRTYSEERDRFARWLDRNYPQLDKADRQYLCRLSYKDFGRLSHRFLTELEGVNRETGEITTIMQALWETNDNLMELLSERYSFLENIKAEQERCQPEKTKHIEERLEEMYIPAAVRRPVLRALDITREVVKAFKGAPECIFVEMARGGKPEQKGQRTLTRKSQLLALYDKCRDEDVPRLREQLEAMGDAADSRLQSEKLFLYYLQLGRCMYTGKPIDLNSLFNEKLYDIDHIYPRSLTKDESLLNNKVLVDTNANERKGNRVVPPEIQQKMLSTWKHLDECGLINDEKMRRLTRTTPFSKDERQGFINRQITETSQATKAVAMLLQELYPETKVAYVKAQLASDFRQSYDRIKSRDYNDLHHARDAYLNIVVGNVYTQKFTSRWFMPENDYTLNTEAIFNQPVICGGLTVWDGKPMLEKVKATLLKNNIHMTRYAFRRQGALFNQQPLKKGEGLVPRKKGMDPSKYGGYNMATISFFVLVKYNAGKKKDVMFTPVELMYADRFLDDAQFRVEYAKKMIDRIRNCEAKEICFPLGDRILKINTVLSLDGFRMCLSGNSSYGKVILLSGHMSFIANYKFERYIKRLRMLLEKRHQNPSYYFESSQDKVTLEENVKLYDLYIDKLQNSVFSKRLNSPVQTLIDGRPLFISLSIQEQIVTLLNIQMLFGRLAGGVDLSSIGGVKRAAATTKSASLSNWLKINSDIRIIDQSASGLWETKSQNLLELL